MGRRKLTKILLESGCDREQNIFMTTLSKNVIIISPNPTKRSK
jgi:hypothetical protein